MTASMNQQLSELLAETIVKFCRKHNYFDSELKVQGTICITSDATSFLVTQISDRFLSPLPKTEPIYEAYRNDQDSPEDLSVIPAQTTKSAYLEESAEGDSPSQSLNCTYQETSTSQSSAKSPLLRFKRKRSRTSHSHGQISFVKQPINKKNYQPLVYEGGVYLQRDGDKGNVNPDQEEQLNGDKETDRSLTPDAEKYQASESIPLVKSEPRFAEESNDVEDMERVSTTLESEYLTPQFASFGTQNVNMSISQNRNAASSFVQKRPDGKYGCALCDVEYSNRGTLQRHIDGRHLGRNYTCVICHVTFESHSGWSRHLRTKHSQHMPLSCEICGKKFKFSMALEQHKRRLHSVEAATKLESKNQPQANAM